MTAQDHVDGSEMNIRDPEKGQLDEVKDKEAQQLCRRNIGGQGQVVGEIAEAGPDGGQHDLDTLPTLVGLRTRPDDCGDRTTNQGKEDTAGTKGCAGKDGKVDTVDTANIAVGGIGTCDQDWASAFALDLCKANKDSSQ